MNTRILTSLFSVGAVVAAVSLTTYAFFSDSGTSSDNIFNSGTLDMQLTDSNEIALDNVSGTWGLASAPGDPFSGDLKIKNSGSVNADHLELKFVNTLDEADTAPGSTATIPMDSVIEITQLLWDHDGDGVATVDLLVGLLDFNGNGINDLDDLENQIIDDFDNVAFGGTQANDHTLHMEGQLHPTLAIDQHQGDSVDMDLTVTMNQDVSQ